MLSSHDPVFVKFMSGAAAVLLKWICGENRPIAGCRSEGTSSVCTITRFDVLKTRSRKVVYSWLLFNLVERLASNMTAFLFWDTQKPPYIRLISNA